MTYADGSSYEGGWDRGEKHGKGLMKIRSDTYTQNFDIIGTWNQGELEQADVIKKSLHATLDKMQAN